MQTTVLAVTATILVCIQAHRNWLMIQTQKTQTDRTADALEKLLKLLEKQDHLREIDRKYRRKSSYR